MSNKAKIQIISNQTDNEIDLVGGKVQDVQRAGSSKDVGEIVKKSADAGEKKTTLDLIGHSRDSCFLNVGDWIVDEQAVSIFDNLQGALKKIGVMQIRLLGCATATTDAGWSAIRSIAHACQIETLGTTRFIDQDDFEDSGFKSEHVLASSKTGSNVPTRNDRHGPVKQARSVELSTLTLTRAGFEAFGTRQAQVDPSIWREILSCIEGDKAWELPGLLALPLLEVSVPLDGRVQRCELLIEYRYLRVYSAGYEQHGLLYLVRDPERLIGLLRQLGLLSQLERSERSGIQARSM